MKIKILILILICMFCGINLFSQTTRKPSFEIHDIGMLWETMKDDGTIGAPDPTSTLDFYPSMDWPGGPHQLDNKNEQRSYMVGAGIWIGGKDNSNEVFFTENGPFSWIDNGEFSSIEKVENLIGSNNFDSTKAEQTIIVEWTTTENINVKRKSMAWSSRNYNNFIIIDFVITNQNSYSLSDVYIGFSYLLRPSYQDQLVHNGWGNDLNLTDEMVDFDSTLNLLYAYDSYPDFPGMEYDLGNYWSEYEEMRTPGYAGFSLIYSDINFDGSSSQPANIFWAQLLGNESEFTIDKTNKNNMYAILNGNDRSLQVTDSTLRLDPFTLMSCGPYNIGPSKSVHIVLVEAVNGLTLEEVNNIDNTEKMLACQSKLPAGLDSLKNSIERAKFLYNNNYVITNRSEKTPEIEIIPSPQTQTISISWAPIENEDVIDEYRIYRNEKSFIGPFVSYYKRIRPSRSLDQNRYFNQYGFNRWTYEDQNVNLGVGYYYAVTTLNNNGIESWMCNRNELAVTATNLPDSTLNIKVFPNPFRQKSGFLNPSSANHIVFTHLPEKCTIKIFTTSGELIKTIKHDNAFSGEHVWEQLTNARQRTAPGIYFWTVNSEVGTAKGSLIIIK